MLRKQITVSNFHQRLHVSTGGMEPQ
jgi:hypothetical protein